MFSTGLQEMMQKEVYSCVRLVEEIYAAGMGLAKNLDPVLFNCWEERGRDGNKGELLWQYFKNPGLDVAMLAYS